MHVRPASHRFGSVAAAVVAMVFLAASARAAATAPGPVVEGIRHSTTAERTRVVLDLDRGGSFEVRRVGNPDRLAVNIPGGSFGSPAAVTVADGLVRGVRCNVGTGRAQVVLDLEAAAEFRSFSLPAESGRPARIVIDVLRGAATTAVRVPAPNVTAEAKPAPEPAPVAEPGRPFTVVIDPGHGGEDPGAIRRGMQEKDVVLEVALEAARLIDALPGYRAVLTRDRDVLPTLEQRVDLAAAEAGDLFLSIHCNTHGRSEVAGMEVYFLSLQGATDREAQELADKENAAQLVGLAGGDEVDDAVVGILMDLRMSRVLHESSRLADAILDAAYAGGTVDVRRVKQARFRVLTQLAMPAVLVELAYLSNADDRALLADPAARKRLAEDLVAGIADWRRDREAAAVLARGQGASWSGRYEVRRGDSLWSVARRHNTSVDEITRRNDLSGSGIAAGQVLRVPAPGRNP
jgi:N-acetylmuramoyl-L-alanine amidase